MKMGPLGWELTAALLAVVALVVASVLHLETLVMVVATGIVVLTPLILCSAGIRLAAGIVEEDRRYRRAKSLR